MIIYKPSDHESIDEALKRFRKKCERDGIQKELKKRAFYMKPSLKKKRDKEVAERKLKKKLRKAEARERKHG